MIAVGGGQYVTSRGSFRRRLPPLRTFHTLLELHEGDAEIPRWGQDFLDQ